MFSHKYTTRQYKRLHTEQKKAQFYGLSFVGILLPYLFNKIQNILDCAIFWIV